MNNEIDALSAQLNSNVLPADVKCVAMMNHVVKLIATFLIVTFEGFTFFYPAHYNIDVILMVFYSIFVTLNFTARYTCFKLINVDSKMTCTLCGTVNRINECH